MRVIDPPEVQGWTVVILGGLALAVDTLTAMLTYSMQKGSVNRTIKIDIKEWLKNRFGITHSSLEFEHADHAHGNADLYGHGGSAMEESEGPRRKSDSV